MAQQQGADASDSLCAQWRRQPIRWCWCHPLPRSTRGAVRTGRYLPDSIAGCCSPSAIRTTRPILASRLRVVLSLVSSAGREWNVLADRPSPRRLRLHTQHRKPVRVPPPTPPLTGFTNARARARQLSELTAPRAGCLSLLHTHGVAMSSVPPPLRLWTRASPRCARSSTPTWTDR